jgi:hypothetical protein
MRAGGFDWPNNEQTPATSTHIGHCPRMMERPTILKKLVVIERRFYPNLHMTRQLVLYRVSYNAGVVKYFFSTLLHPLRDERHFALVEISAIPTKARS